VVKANKFVLDLLSKLKIKCFSCGKSGINYDTYIRHVEICGIYKRFSSSEELLKIFKERENKVEELKAELESLKKNFGKLVESKENQIKLNFLSKEELRNLLVSSNLPVKQKMELYEAAVKGNLSEFKNLILNKMFPILEEVSAHNFFWTSLHYAMHYGQIEIVMFILEHLNSSSTLESAMLLESSDGRCPLLCLLRSNSLDLAKKKDIVEKIFSKYNTLNISAEVKKEMSNRDMDSLLKKYKKI